MKRFIKFCSAVLLLALLLPACGYAGAGSAGTDGKESTNGGADSASGNTAASAISTGTAETPENPADPEDPRYGTAVNIDADAITYLLRANGGDYGNLKEKCLAWFNSHYADCGVSDLLYNVNNLSDVWDDAVDRYNRKEENGVAVDYTENESVLAIYNVYTKTDVDPWAEWISACRSAGIRPWLSFRMNDVHYASNATGHSPFFYEAKEKGWMIGNSRASYWMSGTTQGSHQWYQYALNYAVPEVRAHFLDYIDEQLGRYDVYGIELDWQRVIWCFPSDTPDNCQYMNLFMEALNGIVSKYEEQYGHPIRIAAHINRDIEENRWFGFDVAGWAERDWIDVVIPSGYWGSTDTDMPIAAWKKALKNTSVEVWAGVECHVMNSGYWQSIASLAGQTAAYLNAGADKMYLYNLFNDTKAKFEVCASLKNAMNAAKRSYIVTESNCTPYAAQFVEYHPLPLAVKVNEPSNPIVVRHGALNDRYDTVLYIGIGGVAASEIDESTLKVFYNGVECTYRGPSARSYVESGTGMGAIVCFAVPKSAAADSVKGSVVFDVNMDLTVRYVEVMNGNTRI